MSNYQMKDNSGSLFGNERREKDSHPHAKGSAVIDGREYWVDAWTNTDKNGKRYQSLKFKLKEQRGEPRKPYSEPARHDDLDDDLPPF